jgi:16S rRNA (uracil1498-N3)-methyltransferase
VPDLTARDPAVRDPAVPDPVPPWPSTVADVPGQPSASADRPSASAGRAPRSAGRAPGSAGTGTPPVFIADRASLERDVVSLSGPEGRHAATVRRLRPGERADLTDGDGMIAECVVAAARPGLLELTVLRRHVVPPPQPRICVVQAIPKGDRGEQAVETMTEVGVDVIVPWAAERCVAVWPAGGKDGNGRGGRGRDGQVTRGQRGLDRWRATAREAAKQSRRPRIPEVTDLAGTPGVAARSGLAACTVVLEPDAAIGLGDLPLPSSGEIVVIVGPEGGVSPAERAAFEAVGAVAARLGPTVLRTSTAGAAAAVVLLSRSGRW